MQARRSMLLDDEWKLIRSAMLRIFRPSRLCGNTEVAFGAITRQRGSANFGAGGRTLLFVLFPGHESNSRNPIDSPTGLNGRTPAKSSIDQTRKAIHQSPVLAAYSRGFAGNEAMMLPKVREFPSNCVQFSPSQGLMSASRIATISRYHVRHSATHNTASRLQDILCPASIASCFERSQYLRYWMYKKPGTEKDQSIFSADSWISDLRR